MSPSNYPCIFRKNILDDLAANIAARIESARTQFKEKRRPCETCARLGQQARLQVIDDLHRDRLKVLHEASSEHEPESRQSQNWTS
jgi:hypothetical protein